MPSTYNGQVFVYPHYDSVANAPSINLVFPNQANPTYGYWVRLIPAGNIRAISSLAEGEMRPGYAPPHTPDFTSGTVGSTTESHVVYNTIGSTDTTSYAEWTIPSRITANLDTVIYFPSGTTDGTFDLIRNRGGTLTTVASAVASTSSVSNPTTINLSSSLTGGDKIRWKKHDATGNATNCASMQLYDSAGSCTDSTQDFILTYQVADGTRDIGFSSSMEQAVEIAPPGSTIGQQKFVGGIAHQGGIYAQESNVTEQWSNNGTNITLGVGMTRGHLILTRTSKLDFNDSGANPDLASNTVTYEVTDFGIKATVSATADVDNVLIGERFMMLPIAGTTASIDAADGSKPIDIISISAHGWANNPKFLWTYGTPQSSTNAVIMAPFFTGNGMAGADIEDKGSHTGGGRNGKHYVSQLPSATPTGSNTLTAVGLNASIMNMGAYYFGGASTGPAAPTVASCAVGADGLIVTIVCHTKSGGMQGNTGFGLKRSGSALLISSTTANTDWQNGTCTYTILLNSASRVFVGDTITYSYTAGTVTDLYGVALANIADTSATNDSTQTSGPAVSNLRTSDNNGLIILGDITPGCTPTSGTGNTAGDNNGAGSYTGNVSSWSISGGTITFTMDSPLMPGDTLIFNYGASYAGPTGPIVDGSGNPLADYAINVTNTVSQVLANIVVTPAFTSLTNGDTQDYTATAYDQFGVEMSPQPSFTWSVPSGGGSFSGSTYTSDGSSAIVKVTSGSISGVAYVNYAISATTLRCPRRFSPLNGPQRLI